MAVDRVAVFQIPLAGESVSDQYQELADLTGILDKALREAKKPGLQAGEIWTFQRALMSCYPCNTCEEGSATRCAMCEAFIR